jgi:hypothetical protein
MRDITAVVDAIEPLPHAVTPTLGFALRLVNGDASMPIAGVMLAVQVMIEGPRRAYSPEERVRLEELFGDLDLPGRAVRSLVWTHANLNVPAFERECTVTVPVSCGFDFNVAVTRYFHALREGAVPLAVQLSGTVFFHDDHGRLQISRIPWSCEARALLPVATWQALRDRYYPDTAWLCLNRDAFERLNDFRRDAALPSWEHALSALLDAAAQRRAARSEIVR